MRSSRLALLVLVTALLPRTARAQQQEQGYALDRLYLSAPGGQWFVMDALDLHGGLGGAMSLTTSYAHDPMRVRTTDGSERLTVVSGEALADFGFAATYDRFRLYINLDVPLDVTGNSGVVGNYQFCAPNANQPFTPSGVNPSTTTDAFADGRIGVDARILGRPGDAFRLGAGAQLFIPSPNTFTSEYITDGTFRAMGRALVAGDIGRFSYAGQLGAHLRPRDDAPAPGPQGSELLFGVAAGSRFAVGDAGKLALVVGPEIWGESAFRSLFGQNTTGVEGLMTGRVEGTANSGPQVRVKLGLGAGLDQRFGAPQWRLVLAVELFDRSDRSR